MRIRPFAVEQWMNAYESRCESNLAETCVESLTVDQLLELAGMKADRWIAGQPRVSYVRPRAGTTALLKYGLDMPSREFCVRLLEETGVMFTPGSAFDLEGCVRIGYANNEAILEAGLTRTSEFLRRTMA